MWLLLLLLLLQAEYEDMLQQQAALRQELQALQGGGVLRHTPDKSVAVTPAGKQAGEAKVAAAQHALHALISLQVSR